MAFKIERVGSIVRIYDTIKNTVTTTPFISHEINSNQNFNILNIYAERVINDASYDQFLDINDVPYTSNQALEDDLNIFANLFGGGVGRTENRITVNRFNYKKILGGVIDSTKEYFVDGEIDAGTIPINVPSTGLFLSGFGSETSRIHSSETGFTLFTGTGVGNVSVKNMEIEINGTGSKVMQLTATPLDKRELDFENVQFTNCTSLGEITTFEKYKEIFTNKIGGTPELTLNGKINSLEMLNSEVSGTNISYLFKKGTAFKVGERFLLNQCNYDLGATGSVNDFTPTEFNTGESFEILSSILKRAAIINPNDPSIINPGLLASALPSVWINNLGIPKTNKYVQIQLDTEVTTPIALQDTYYPLEGTFNLVKSSKFSIPGNGVIELLSGSGEFNIVGDTRISGTANDVIEIRVVISSDQGSNWTEVNHIGRTINDLVGPLNIAFIPFNFISTINQGDWLRLEVKNISAANDLTARIDTFLIVTQL